MRFSNFCGDFLEMSEENAISACNEFETRYGEDVSDNFKMKFCIFAKIHIANLCDNSLNHFSTRSGD